MPPKLDPEVEALRSMLSARDAPPSAAPTRPVNPRPIVYESQIETLRATPTADELNSASTGRGDPHNMIGYKALQDTANQVRKEIRSNTAPGTASYLDMDLPKTSTRVGPVGQIGPVGQSAESISSFRHTITPSQGAVSDAANSLGKFMWESTEKQGYQQQSELESMIHMPPSQRAEKALQFVKFWQRPALAVTPSALQTGPAELVSRVRASMAQNDWKLSSLSPSSVHPHYLVLAVLLLFLLTSSHMHPANMAFRPQGLFYYHNKAYDTCVSHYNVCLSGKYKPIATPLGLTPGLHTVEGLGGIYDGCKTAYAFVLTSDEYMPGVLTAVYSLRKHAKEAHDFVVIVTPEVSEQARSVLYQACVIVREHDAIENPLRWERKNHKVQNEQKNLFTKLAVWWLSEYDKVMYVDADLMVLRSFDPLFKGDLRKGEDIAAPAFDFKETKHIGPYAFLLRPSDETAKRMEEKMVSMYKQHQNAFDESDVGFLTDFFPSWAQNPTYRWEWATITVDRDVIATPEVALQKVNQTSRAFKMTEGRHHKPWLQGLNKFQDQPNMLKVMKIWWTDYYEMTDRPLPQSMDMYSLLELSEYDLYWRQMYSVTRSRKWIG